MVMVYISLYLCLLLSLIAIGALLIRSLIEAIKESHGAKVKDPLPEYYDRLWKEFQKKNKTERRAERLQRKHARNERREKERKRREFEREERRFKRALNHIERDMDKGNKGNKGNNIKTPNNGADL